jgi:uncharacterized protein
MRTRKRLDSTIEPLHYARASLQRHAEEIELLTHIMLRSFVLLVAALIFPGCNIQDNFLYFPDSSVPNEEFLRTQNIGPWPSSKDYRGLVSVNPAKQTNGAVIVFHGNAGTAADRVLYVKALGALGYRVILAEYPRYGGRKGTLGEKPFVHDGVETVRLAFEQFGGPLFLLGESLGAGVAAAVAKETSVTIDGVILITPWDRLASVAQSKYPFLPVRLLLTDTYDTIDNLRSFKGRIVVVGAGRDEIIPIEHANNLYRSFSSAAKKMWTIKDAGHNDWPGFINASWWREIMDFASGQDNG